ncbi:MAG: hypothetical protein QX189_16420 [Methylococcales bacterium]
MISQKPKVQSHFVTYISVKDNSKINDKLTSKVAEFFWEKNITQYESIAENSEISDVDFKKVEFSYFYDVIFYDIAKNKQGKIEIPVKYCITLDETNCSKTCEITKIRYDEILLYNQPVFYFIYIDIKEIFACLRR